jgi:hypothetical protein
MKNRPTSVEAEEPTDSASPTGTPRWVKVFALALAVLVLLIAILLITGIGGEHGPSRHAPPAGDPDSPAQTGGHAPPPSHGETVTSTEEDQSP